MSSGFKPESSDPAAEAAVEVAPDIDCKTLGKYELQRRIGAGGMGCVYLAMDTDLKRTVALKILTRERATEETLVRRFQAEAQAAARLKHDNIVTVYDAGNVDGYLYIALEYVDGTDVYDMLAKRGRFSVESSVEIVKQVVRALEHAHSQGIVHRDIKPSNLLVTRDGTVKLTDMGLARSVDDSVHAGITRSGTTVGTVDYMAPEQARDSQAADIRSDIYSLGCTWYQMLTGNPPFPAGSLTNKLYAHIAKPRPDPRDINDQVSNDVVAALHKMMARKPEDRYQTPTELLKDLDQIDLKPHSAAEQVYQVLSEVSDADETGFDQAVESPKRERRSRTRKPQTHRPEQRSDRPLAPPPRVDVAGRASAKRGGSKKRASGSLFSRIAALLSGEGEAAVAQDDYPVREPKPPKAAKPLPERKRKRPASGQSRKQKEAGPASISEDIPDRLKPKPSVPAIDLRQFLIPVAAAAVLIGAVWWLVAWSIRQSQTAVVGGENNPLAPAIAAGEIQEKDRKRRSRETGSQPSSTENEETASGSLRKRQPPEPDGIVAVNVDAQPEQPDKQALIPFGRPAEREATPLWVAEVWSPEPHELPPGAEQLTTITVGRTDGEPAQFADLESAFDTLPPVGGVIQLVGDGPFLLGPTQVKNRKLVIVTAAAGSRPVIALAPGGGQTGDAILQFSNSSLILAGVDLTLHGDLALPEQYSAWVGIDSGDLCVRRCSITQADSSAAPTTVFHLSGLAELSESRPDGHSRVLLERSFFHGDAMSAIALDQPAADVVASQCLFVSGTEPAIKLASSSADLRPDVNESDAARRVRLFSCTLVSGRSAFELHPGGDAAAPPSVRLHALNSVIASTGQQPPTCLLGLGSWPGSISPDQGTWVPKSLTVSAESTLLSGWDQILLADAAGVPNSVAPGHWQSLWGEAITPVSFAVERWAVIPAQGASAEGLQSLDFSAVELSGVRASDGGLPGCDKTLLQTANPFAVARARALLNRPAPPADLTGAGGQQPVRVIEVNLRDRKSNDLGKIMAEKEWPSGTVFKVSGLGTVECSPIRVRNKSFRIEFESSPMSSRQPLVLELMDDERGGSRRDANRRAFISVSNGSVEIENGRFKIPRSTRRTVGRWFLQVTDGSFSLRNCRIHGPMQESVRYNGLIEWLRTGNDRSSETGSAEPGEYAHISDSFLASWGFVLSGDITGRGMLVENSVLVGPDKLFDLKFDGAGDGAQAAAEFDHCTLSAGSAFFAIHKEQSSPAVSSPLRFFVNTTVFAQPPDGNTGQSTKPALFVLDGAETPAEIVDWWEGSNAYWSNIIGFSREGQDTEGSPSSTIDESWQALWDPGRVRRMLAEPGGVLLAETLPEPAKIEPASFALHEASQASGWAVDGSSIGADVESFDPKSARPRSNAPRGQRTLTTPRRPGKRKPSGF